MEQKTPRQAAYEHYEWIESVGWKDNRTLMESLTRIGSEIGELANECRGDVLGDGFPDELSDVLLSCFTVLGEIEDIPHLSFAPINSFAQHCCDHEDWPAFKVHDYSTPLGAIGYGIYVLGLAILEADRIREDYSPILRLRVHDVIKYFLAFGHKYGLNINDALTEKMAKNQLKGNRGRKK